MKDLFEIMDDNQKTVSDLTVYHENLSRCVRYYGKDLESVKLAAKYAVNSFGRVSSYTTVPYKMTGRGWCIDVYK